MNIAEAHARNLDTPGIDLAAIALAMHYGRGQEALAILERPPLPPPQILPGYSDLLARLRPDLGAKLALLRDVAATLPLRLYLVGGAVRDLLLHQDTSDLDIVVDRGTAADLTTVLAAVAPEIQIQRHDRYHTAVLTWADGTVIDLVTARQETYAAAAAHPQVVPATLMADLSRRDFTINALALALTGAQAGCLVDPFGGLADLDAGYLRTLHANSFYEDPTRLVRGARFAARFNLHLPEHCQREARVAMADGRSETIASLRNHIWQVSYPRQDDRLKHEWSALLAADAWPQALATLESWGGLSYIGSTVTAATMIATLRRYRQWRRYWQQRGLDTYPDLAAVVQHCDAVVQQALLPNTNFQIPAPPNRVSELVAQWRAVDPAAIVLFASRANRAERWLCWQYLHSWRHTKPLLSGHDLAALGYPRGRLYGEILSRLLAAQLDGQLEPTPEAARQWVETQFPLQDI